MVLLRAVPELPGPRVQVRSAQARGSYRRGFSEWVAVATDSSFVSGFLVAVKGSPRGAMARGAEGQEGYECGVGDISQRCYSITKLIYFCVLRGLLYNAVDSRAGKKTARTTGGRVCHDALTCVCGCV